MKIKFILFGLFSLVVQQGIIFAAQEVQQNPKQSWSDWGWSKLSAAKQWLSLQGAKQDIEYKKHLAKSPSFEGFSGKDVTLATISGAAVTGTLGTGEKAVGAGIATAGASIAAQGAYHALSGIEKGNLNASLFGSFLTTTGLGLGWLGVTGNMTDQEAKNIFSVGIGLFGIGFASAMVQALYNGLTKSNEITKQELTDQMKSLIIECISKEDMYPTLTAKFDALKDPQKIFYMGDNTLTNDIAKTVCNELRSELEVEYKKIFNAQKVDVIQNYFKDIDYAIRNLKNSFDINGKRSSNDKMKYLIDYQNALLKNLNVGEQLAKKMKPRYKAAQALLLQLQNEQMIENKQIPPFVQYFGSRK